MSNNGYKHIAAAFWKPCLFRIKMKKKPESKDINSADCIKHGGKKTRTTKNKKTVSSEFTSCIQVIKNAQLIKQTFIPSAKIMKYQNRCRDRDILQTGGSCFEACSDTLFRTYMIKIFISQSFA